MRKPFMFQLQKRKRNKNLNLSLKLKNLINDWEIIIEIGKNLSKTRCQLASVVCSKKQLGVWGGGSSATPGKLCNFYPHLTLFGMEGRVKKFFPCNKRRHQSLKTFWLFVLTLFPDWCKISSLYLVPVPNYPT